MADSKIDFSFENLHFSCEGDNLWVERQLNNVLSRIPALLAVHKKGEGIVEEVIDIEEEDVKEVNDNTGQVQKDKTGKTSQKSSVVKKSPGRKARSAAKSRRGRKTTSVNQAAKSKEPRKAPDKGKPITEKIDSPLARYLADKKADKNQVRKFMATAVFLSRNNNVAVLSTPMISKALKSYGIAKLQNASDCLNKNAKKGNCIKTGKEFTITDAGFLSFSE